MDCGVGTEDEFHGGVEGPFVELVAGEVEFPDSVGVFGLEPLDEEAGSSVAVGPVAAGLAGAHVEEAEIGAHGVGKAFYAGENFLVVLQ